MTRLATWWRSDPTTRPTPRRHRRRSRPGLEFLDLEPWVCLSMLIGNGSTVDRFDETTGAFIDHFVPAGTAGLVRVDELTYGPDGDLYVLNDDFSHGHFQILQFNGTSGASEGVFLDYQ